MQDRLTVPCLCKRAINRCCVCVSIVTFYYGCLSGREGGRKGGRPAVAQRTEQAKNRGD